MPQSQRRMEWHRVDPALIVAAQGGNRQALDGLVAASLPFVYTVVRRALDGDPAVDDVVQDTMLRVLRQLPTLHQPESFRTWLAVIAVRQVGTHLRLERSTAARVTAFDDIADAAVDEDDLENLTAVHVELSDQRRRVARASRWLDPDNRTLMSLWWLETVGELTRADAAAAMNVRVAHAGVRLQRMRDQLELSRQLVAALDARPRCAGLDAAAADWDGRPSPLWRKRLTRHTRSCPVCARATQHAVPVEQLFAAGPALLAMPVSVPAALAGAAAAGAASGAALSGATGISAGVSAAGVTATGAGAASASAGSISAAGIGAASASAGSISAAGVGAGVQASLVGQLVQAVAMHPIVAAVAAGALVAGAAVTTATWPRDTPPATAVAGAPPTTAAAPPPPVSTHAAASPRVRTTTAPPPSATPARPLGPGRVLLESADGAGLFVTTTADNVGVLAPVTASATLQAATFEVVTGLADPACFSFRSADGRYLRHSSWRLRLNADEGTALFRGDATFCPRAGATAGSIELESSNYQTYFVHRRGSELWVDQTNGTATFGADSSFVVRAPLGP